MFFGQIQWFRNYGAKLLLENEHFDFKCEDRGIFLSHIDRIKGQLKID